jgi:inner membrane protein
MLAPTHLMVALAIAYILRLPKLPAAIGGVIPDLDVLLQGDFPLIHRGIVHTPLVMILCMVIIYLAVDRTASLSFGAGFMSHLLTDLATPAGILLLYPLPQFFTLNLAAYNNAAANLGIILWSGFAILLYRSSRFRDWVRRTFGVNIDLPREARG